VRHSPCGAFDLHVLSLPPAFVLSQDQTLKFNVLPEGSEIPSLITLSDLRRNSELATAETFMRCSRRSETRVSAAAGVSLSNQTMHRTRDLAVETHLSERRRFGSQNPPSQVHATFRYTPLSVGGALIWEG
jgi:hypothetical protein